MLPDTLSRTQRTGAQATVSAGTLLLIKYVLDQLGVEIPEDVLIAGIIVVLTVVAKAQNFAEDQGWIQDRRAQ
jgi:hypothetical protein